jgi:hypothetical protein
MTHDLAIAVAELLGAARRIPPQIAEPRTIAELAAKAVAFTVQLAIDTGSDPAQTRALEQALLGALQDRATR